MFASAVNALKVLGIFLEHLAVPDDGVQGRAQNRVHGGADTKGGMAAK